MKPKRLLLAVGAVVGALGLSLGAGLTVADAASGSTSTTTPTSTAPARPSTPPADGNCPNMGSRSSSSTGGSGI